MTQNKERIATHGFIILEPYASKIADGIKVREYRSYDIPKDYMNTPIFLLCKGHIYAIIKFTHTEQLSNENWCWHIELIKKFLDRPKYNHPNGAQRWVRNVKSKQLTLLQISGEVKP